jgi:DNA polymerase-1
VDPDNFARLTAFIGNRLDEATGKLPPGFNVRGRKDVPAAFDAIGVTDYPRTALGNPSFTEAWLEKHELGRDIITVRKLTNLQNSFIQPLLDTHIHTFEGHALGSVHCNFNQLRADEYGTITGRLSCNEPNMQQVPKRDKLLAPIFRQIFVPRPGMVWSQNDYSQQEYRIFAMYSGSELLIDGYKGDLDMHQVVANELKVERDPTAKRLNLGMLYWMGSELLAEELGITVERAAEIRSWYDDKFPDVKAFLKKAQKAAQHRGWVQTILGRRARIPDRNKSYQASSRVIQGTCADLTKLKMVEVDEFLHRESGGKAGVTLQIHDELDWEVSHDDPHHLDTEARRIMSDFSKFPIPVPMKVDSHVANDWGRASFPKTEWSKYT